MPAVSGRRSSIAMNGDAMAGMKDVSPEELATYSNGIQVIDENKEFTPKLPVYLSAQSLLTAGFNYHVVAVFGSQSTGKSTLLNHLFGTQFSVMNETARRQTTKGIWMSRAVEDVIEDEDSMGKNILVMDVEGTDGRERGEDQDFERKSALFALATSEVLIVNIWEHQVGLYQGANMGLLKTVFEVNLGLFLKDKNTTHRSLLFFVIRDHIGVTPLANLSSTLMADLMQIWTSLSKPAGLENSQITDFFDFEFAALPHKVLQPDKFVDETQKLRKRFREGADPELTALSPTPTPKPEGTETGVFLPIYHRRIPADGFPMYAEGIWTQIVSNKDLDLPSQQELLAQYRCDEIAATCTNHFNELMTPFEQQAASGKVLEGLGPVMKQALSEALHGFEEQGGRYHKGVYERKRADLAKALETRLRGLVVGQLGALSKRAVAEFTDEVASVLKKANSGDASGASYDFANVVEQAKTKVVERFKECAEETYIPGPSTTWSNYDDELETLEKDIDQVSARLRAEEMKRLVTRLERTIKQKLGEPVDFEFRKLDPTLWDRVWKMWTTVVDEAVSQFEAKSQSFNATEVERELGVWRLKKRAWGVLMSKVDEEVMEGNILLKLREHFEDRFRYDDTGVPRVWKPTDDIEGIYTVAREATLALVPLLSHIKLTTTSEPPDLLAYLGDVPTTTDHDHEEEAPPSADTFEVLSPSKQLDLSTRFRRMADGVYVEAKRGAIGGVAQVPLWIYGIMVALGWNELWAVLRSPVYFLFLLLCGVVAYVVYTLNLWGPIYRVVNAMMEQGVEVGKERLRDVLAVKDEMTHAGRGNLARESSGISLDTLDQEGRRRRTTKSEDADDEE